MGNCSSTSNCNPCGPDFSAINQLATKAGAYARQANTYATNAENSWLEFNALYLGAFAVAPTVDNEGDPLQVGALYWNTALTQLFAWSGASWVVAANFTEFTPFLATGTTFARNLVTREADVVNVKDFGAVGDGVADDTAAIQAAINTSKQYIYIPQGNYRTTATINLSAVGKYIFGAGNQTTIISAEHTNGPVFQIKQRACRLENLFITAIGARLALATTNGNNHGVQVDGTNDSGTTTLTYIKSVVINNQPDCGMYLTKTALNSIIEQVSCQTNRSHGFLLDDGTYAGVAINRLGIVNFFSCRSTSNGGNAMCISPSGGTCYRIVADNLEAFGNCTNPLVSGLVTAGVLVRCQNATFINCAIESGAGPCFELRSGTTNFYCNNFRAISSGKILNCGSLNIDGIFFDNVYVAPALTSGIGFDLSTGTRGVFIRLANSDGMTTPVRADSRSGYFWIGNDQYRIYEGTLHYLENGSNAYTIASGTVRVAATSIELTGEGNVADSVSYIAEPQAGGVPEDGTRFTLINPNAYNITINDGTVNIETRGGVNIVLAQNDAATFVMYGGIAYES